MNLQETVTGEAPVRPQLTLGEYRVGKSFNPSSLTTVDQIKKKAADLIDYLDQFLNGDPEVIRLVAHAQTLIEDAAMNGVKAVTKQPR